MGVKQRVAADSRLKGGSLRHLHGQMRYVHTSTGKPLLVFTYLMVYIPRCLRCCDESFREGEDIEAAQQLLGTAKTSGPAVVSTDSSEARLRTAPATASTPPASPRAASTTRTAAGKRRCSKHVVCAYALVLLGLG